MGDFAQILDVTLKKSAYAAAIRRAGRPRLIRLEIGRSEASKLNVS
jgi:hypothetical protein